MEQYINTNVFFIFLFNHLLGDFYCYVSKSNELKYKNIIWHSLFYALPFVVEFVLLFTLCGCRALLFYVVIANIIGHWLFETVEYIVMLKGKNCEKILYIIKQLLHIVIILVSSIFCNQLHFQIPQSAEKILIHCVFFMFLCKPANTTFIKLYGDFRVDSDGIITKHITSAAKITHTNENDGKPGAGKIIGNFERLLCGIFILLGEYGALGLTITAKSIARYDKISKDAAFSEYYIIGTLFSVFYTIAIYFSLYHII